MIYFIGNKDFNICKIGFSERPYRRIETLRGQSPYALDIYSIVDGTIDDEKMYHSKYFEHRLSGEWFRLDKVEELGFSKDMFTISIGDIILNVNKKNNYIHVPSMMAIINRDRITESKNAINFKSWCDSNVIFVSTIENPIIKETCSWCHPYIAIELIRKSTIKNKIKVYELMYSDKNFNTFLSKMIQTKL